MVSSSMAKRLAADFESVLAQLRAQARPDQRAAMARFGIVGAGRLGVAIPVLRRIARGIGRDQMLAAALWDSGIPDARILAALLADPARTSSACLDRWVAGIESWDVGDQFCLNLVGRSPHAWTKAAAWAARRPEFIRRAGFATMAVLAVHDRAAAADRFASLLPLIEHAASDERNYVKKAVNWALRQIGKRNPSLRRAAIDSARRIAAAAGSTGAGRMRAAHPGSGRARSGSAARWIAKALAAADLMLFPRRPVA
jgi:3-methyladenine DNA glycosylase AlkD